MESQIISNTSAVDSADVASGLVFGGVMSVQQLIIIIVGIGAIILALKLLKKIPRIIVSVALTAVMIIAFVFMLPEQLVDIDKYIDDNGIEAIEKIDYKSEYIRVSRAANETDVQIQVDNTWISVKSIKRLVTKDNSAILLLKDDKTVVIDDKCIIELIQLLKK